MTIQVPKGAKISSNSSVQQCELLFPRNAKFKVVKEAHVTKPGIEFTSSKGEKMHTNDTMAMTVKYVGTGEKTSILDKIKRFLHI